MAGNFSEAAAGSSQYKAAPPSHCPPPPHRRWALPAPRSAIWAAQLFLHCHCQRNASRGSTCFLPVRFAWAIRVQNECERLGGESGEQICGVLKSAPPWKDSTSSETSVLNCTMVRRAFKLLFFVANTSSICLNDGTFSLAPGICSYLNHL